MQGESVHLQVWDVPVRSDGIRSDGLTSYAPEDDGYNSLECCYVRCYVDDVVIFSKNNEIHVIRLGMYLPS